jgi:alcohol dehydrogenase class IV
LALANAGLGAVHGFAGPIGGMFPAPHGAVCAALLPHVFAANYYALRTRGTGGTLGRFDRVAAVLTGEPNTTAPEAIHWLTQLVNDLQIPRLGSFGVRREDIPEIVKKAAAASSMKPNPVVLSGEEMTVILERAI